MFVEPLEIGQQVSQQEFAVQIDSGLTEDGRGGLLEGRGKDSV